MESKERFIAESKALVDDLADLAVHLFALYDRELLMNFLNSSMFYTFEKATQECEKRDYVPESVYLYSKTGQTKRALTLIIDRLRDVPQAIAFAKSQDDMDLWNNLLDYSMDKPRFIRGLLEEVGTAINHITLVRRIPEGLEIEGLRESLSRMIKEYEIQYSVSSGFARVLRCEAALTQTNLRSGQRKGVNSTSCIKETITLISKYPMSRACLPTPTTPLCRRCQPEKSPKGSPKTVPNLHHPSRAIVRVVRKHLVDWKWRCLWVLHCGHVFHLSHLLGFAEDGEERPNKPPEGALDENGEWTNMYSVGAKVTYARLLRDRIRYGCPVCTRAKEVL